MGGVARRQQVRDVNEVGQEIHVMCVMVWHLGEWHAANR